MVRTMNRVISGVKTDTKKTINSEYHISQKDIAEKLGNTKATYQNMSAKVYSKGRPIRLAKFKVKKNKSPGKSGNSYASVKVKKSGSGGEIKGAFVATMNNGVKGVFVRESYHKKGYGSGIIAGRKSKEYGGSLREPIYQLYGPGVASMMNEYKVIKVVNKKGNERFVKRLDHEIDYILKKGK